MDRATSILLVTNQDLSSVRAAAATAATLRQRFGSQRLRLVINRYDKRASVSAQDVAMVTREPVAWMVPNDFHVAVEAINSGKPFTLQDGKLAAAVRQVAAELTNADASAKPAGRPSPAAVVAPGLEPLQPPRAWTRTACVRLLVLAILAGVVGPRAAWPQSASQLPHAEAWRALEEHRYGDAAGLFAPPSRETPTDAALWFGAGVSALMRGLNGQAQASFEQSLALDPGSARRGRPARPVVLSRRTGRARRLPSTSARS